MTVPSPWAPPPVAGALPTWSPAWFAIGDRAKSDLSLIRNGYTPQSFDSEQRREHSRASAMSPITNKVSVNVYVDGKLIPSTSRVVNSASGFDGREFVPYPDHVAP